MNTLYKYTLGYVLSIAATIGAVGLFLLHENTHHSFPTHPELRIAFIVLAVAQLVVQLFFFLHIGKGKDRHWNAVSLVVTLFIVCVVVGGTLWIMSNLHASMSGNPFIDNQITPQTED